ncbi:MAG: nucleotide pyrophosphohydrolase [Gemmataceae bacterium]
MTDQSTTVQELREIFREFVTKRQWTQFHSPKNLAMSLVVETAELLEHFLWMENSESLKVTQDSEQFEAIRDEIADVAGNIFCLCNALGVDLSEAVRNKMSKNVVKYPEERFQGRYK